MWKNQESYAWNLDEFKKLLNLKYWVWKYPSWGWFIWKKRYIRRGGWESVSTLGEIEGRKGFYTIVQIFRCDSISRNALYTGHLLTYTLSSMNLLGQVSRPFRQSKDVKKGNREIIAITAIMTITVSMTIAAITVIWSQSSHFVTF